ncbi:DUF3172 domain-containing protein [Tolypothrix bouteillei VB521301]|uniref:DUF3172 domain-containing protein n=3 Tax=Nostocales TaxID=1161 RepID=A0A0C1QWF5_9CYAN|nr:DUF3172 domain-containing protein [Tolypothrix bouteillei]KAF3891237.1 DUF3172 domain-containing protein [Tolypothrix bouteillei VB521301]
MVQRTQISSNKSFSFRTNTTIAAIIGTALVVGILIGVSVSTVANSSPDNVASSTYIDSSAPDADVCVQYGASAIVTDARIFVTLNPFRVYVSQPRMQPGCVLRTSDWSILQQKNLVTSQQISTCKNSLNTFAYTGKLENSPQISCVYPNNAAGNLFVPQATTATTTP